MNVPAIRVFLARELARQAAQLPSFQAGTALDPHYRGRLEALGALDWVPLSEYVQWCSDILDAGGVSTYHRMWHQAADQLIGHTALRAVIEEGAKLFGTSPAAPLRMTPFAWNVVSRSCGRMRVLPTSDEHTVELEHRDVPDVAWNARAWIEGIRGGLGFSLELFGARGEIEVDMSAEHERTAYYIGRWSDGS